MISWMRHNKYFLLGSLFILALLGFFTLTLKAQWTIENINLKNGKTQEEIIKSFNKNGGVVAYGALPKNDPNRLNILLVGMRGLGVGDGDLLTDTIILVSLNETTGQAAIISIPRDLYIAFPYEDKKRKINELYVSGYEKGGEQLAFGITKTMLSQITGVYIDAMVRVDFEGFRKLIDAIGGIDVRLDKPFVEITQWQGIGGFVLPAGWNHLNGDQALFYARSRFSTSDFDRARRQHDILFALKNKITTLGILSNPVKIYTILDIIGSHMKTDAGIDVPQALALANKIHYSEVTKLILTTENYLYHTTAPNGAYILLPKGDSFSQIQQAIQDIFTKNPLPSGIEGNSDNEGNLNNNNALQKPATSSQSSQRTHATTPGL